MMPSSRSRHQGTRWFLLCFSTTLLATGCERSSTTPQTERQLDASRVIVSRPDKAVEEPPLLLLDDDAETETTGKAVADNSRCFVCHVNYMEEQIAANHARQNIGCAHCHGASDAHIADESWGSGGNGTAPDIMYPREKINPACMTCHPQDKMKAPQHEPVFARSDPKVCTDCHGNHRLPKRRCKWR